MEIISAKRPRLKVMVLAGGPDRERPVSLRSGKTVADALIHAGHDVLLRDINPDDLSVLDEWERWGGDVIFPVLHGPWGEGGGLQRLLDEREIRYVGCRTQPATRCMDKHLTKRTLIDNDLPTPGFEILTEGQAPSISPPLVLKPLKEGSSLGVMICRTPHDVRNNLTRLSAEFSEVLAEQFVEGRELTVGLIEDQQHLRALPPIEIVPPDGFYDYQAKYDRDDTRYRVGPQQIDLPANVLENVEHLAIQAHRALGCRHLSRVDFIVDHQHQPWILEINTIPGFTDHSLLPMAAVSDGIDIPKLVDKLVRAALQDD